VEAAAELAAAAAELAAAQCRRDVRHAAALRSEEALAAALLRGGAGDLGNAGGSTGRESDA
jgi:hypothetical protein